LTGGCFIHFDRIKVNHSFITPNLRGRVSWAKTSCSREIRGCSMRRPGVLISLSSARFTRSCNHRELLFHCEMAVYFPLYRELSDDR
jgi:hypothetical protein